MTAVYNPTFSSRRVVVMDLGHSTILRANTLPLKKLTWAHIADVQEDTQAGMMLICGAPVGWHSSAKTTYFKDWQSDNKKKFYNKYEDVDSYLFEKLSNLAETKMKYVERNMDYNEDVQSLPDAVYTVREANEKILNYDSRVNDHHLW